jgi:hypothetical protein
MAVLTLARLAKVHLPGFVPVLPWLSIHFSTVPPPRGVNPTTQHEGTMP